MKNKKRIAAIIRLIARMWGSLFLLFLLFMVGAHVIDAITGTEGASGKGFESVSETLLFFFCFPVGTMVGLALAWKWEGLGGVITVGGFIGLFVMRPDLISNPYMVGMGICGLLFLAYWALTRGPQLETEETGEAQRKTNRNNIAIALLISLVPLLTFIWSTIANADNSIIITEKDSSYSKKVERVDVIVNIEEPMMAVFAHSFEHSLVSAFELNDVEAIVTINSPEPDSLEDTSKEESTDASVSTMRINIKPLYRKHDEGSKVIIGTDYEASLIDMATNKRVWHATGKVDYILKSFSNNPNYKEGEGVRKEFAWNTTAAIVNAFIAEINSQEPKEIFTVTEDRQRKGQRID
jgi:hypothetical protein